MTSQPIVLASQLIFANYDDTQILNDWHLIGIVLALSGIVTCLLLLGEAIPYLRDDVTTEQDAENPHGINVRK